MSRLSFKLKIVFLWKNCGKKYFYERRNSLWGGSRATFHVSTPSSFGKATSERILFYIVNRKTFFLSFYLFSRSERMCMPCRNAILKGVNVLYHECAALI